MKNSPEKPYEPNNIEVNAWSEPEAHSPHTMIGQHFLRDGMVIEAIVDSIPAGGRDIEIGPGQGQLTQPLLDRGDSVLAYEVDTRFRPRLENLAETHRGQLNIKWKSILDVSIQEIDEFGRPVNVVGNIPYHITEPLIGQTLPDIQPNHVTLLVGERAARAMLAPHPDSPAWSRLTVYAQATYDTQLVAEVPKESFDPPPPVDGAVITLTPKEDDPRWNADVMTQTYRRVVDAGRQNTTIGAALKNVIITPTGDAASVRPRRQGGTRIERRGTKQTLRDMTTAYNTGGMNSISNQSREGGLNVEALSVVQGAVDDRLLSKPLGGLDNHELRKIFSRVSTEVNRRKKR